jgi:hypothetical protein
LLDVSRKFGYHILVGLTKRRKSWLVHENGLGRNVRDNMHV